MTIPPLMFLMMTLSCPIKGRVPPEFAALPIWPQDGKVSKTLDGNNAFRDPENDQIVIAYPTEPGQSRQDSRLTPRREYVRMYLSNRVAPVVSSAVSRNSEGHYVCIYEVENCLEAKRPISRWYVAKPSRTATDPPFQASHPTWRAGTAAALGTVVPSTGPLPFISWTLPRGSIAPGTKVGGFRVISSFRPGLTTSYAIASELTSYPDEPDSDWLRDLLPLKKFGVSQKVTVAIGPRFSPETSSLLVASAFVEDVEALIQDEWLDGQSPFIQQLLSRLRSYVQTQGSSGLGVQASPHPGFETEIANAIRLSL
ncbi:MAG: hypothetical protein A3H94_01660 [Acidobacteria bacterium RIFCSPLOWO2_02_FULL_60_20]|nr:MAG: hypothetical protein A3H94_01660 [Acidobacteria bacterium RIFCSPLOWO2_02_FULL_60_20]